METFIIILYWAGMSGFFLLIINLFRYFFSGPHYLNGIEIKLIHFLLDYNDEEIMFFPFAFMLPAIVFLPTSFEASHLPANEVIGFISEITIFIMKISSPFSILGLLYSVIRFFYSLFIYFN